jgi:uncharacterized protein YegP (UPF0339 family)
MTFPKYQIYKDKSGKFRFRLFAANAKNILYSEGYKTRGACLNGIASVKRNALKKERFVINKAKTSKKVYFNLVAGNKEISILLLETRKLSVQVRCTQIENLCTKVVIL